MSAECAVKVKVLGRARSVAALLLWSALMGFPQDVVAAPGEPAASTGESGADLGIPDGYMIIEGDIVVPEDFYETLGPRGCYAPNLWTNGLVPYEFDANVNVLNQTRAIDAMAEWEAVSGVAFVLRTNEPNFIHIQDNPTTNNSEVGMVGGRQNINIVSWSFRFIIAHELAHALGVWHEQSRADRDTFVQINFANVTLGSANNFLQRCTTTQQNGAYDFDSRMHYGECFFSSCAACPDPSCGLEDGRTITVLPPNDVQWQSAIGQRTHLSNGDQATMAFLYPTSNLPAGGFDTFKSVGWFGVRFHPSMGLPSVGIKVSDPSTTVLRSGPHTDVPMGDTSGPLGDGASGCTTDPAPATTDAQIGYHPPGFERGSAEEVHTEICDMSLANSDGWVIRAGEAAPGHPLAPNHRSLGEVESRGPGGTGFPADAFFNLFIEVDVPASAGGPMTLFNWTPMLVQMDDINGFPPVANYLHSFSTIGLVNLYDKTTQCLVAQIDGGFHGVGAFLPIFPPPPPVPFPVVYSVDVGAEGLLVPDPCAPFGHPEPNDVYALGTVPPGLPPGMGPGGHGYMTEGELFQSSGGTLGLLPDMTNVDRISSALGIGPAPAGGGPFMGPFDPNSGAPIPAPGAPGGPVGTMGLIPGDNVNALSFGRDSGNRLFFSVDPTAVGLAGSAVNAQAVLTPPSGGPAGGTPPSNAGGNPGEEAAGDVYYAAPFGAAPWPVGAFGGFAPPFLFLGLPLSGNALIVDELLLGLQAPERAFAALGRPEDDLDALEYGDANTVDSTPMDGIPDTVPSYTPVFVSLDPPSPSIGLPDPFPGVAAPGVDPDGVTPDDILVSAVPPPVLAPFAFAIYARGVLDIGLLPGDDLDALVLFDAGLPGVLGPGDIALFSLAVGSPSLAPMANPSMPGPGPFSPGDVFFTAFFGPGSATIGLYAPASALGLTFTDELNALDIFLTPDHDDEPPCDFCDGDVDGDGDSDFDDVVATIECVGAPPQGGCAGADLDCSGHITAGDTAAAQCLFEGNPPEACCPPSDCITNEDCNINNACLFSECFDGVCIHNTAFDVATECCNPGDGTTQPIDDGNPCTSDKCDPFTGNVDHQISAGTHCDGGVFDSTVFVCDPLGNCVGSPLSDTFCTSDADCPASLCGIDGRCTRTGACCNPADGTCNGATAGECGGGGGVFIAGGDCAAGACTLGACCQVNGTCDMLSSSLVCDLIGLGSFQGFGTTCEPNCCPQSPTGADNCLDASEHVINVPPFPDPPVSVTISGDTSGATGPDCLLVNNDDLGWWEAFSIDTSAIVEISFCCTDPPQTPVYPSLFTDCPCDGTMCSAPADILAVIDALISCGDGNGSAVWELPAGVYYYPVSATNSGPYQMHITVQSAPEAACCTVDGCLVTDRLTCETNNGKWLEEVVQCFFSPCDVGACCVGPGECDGSLTAEADCAVVGGTFIGGASCAEDPCPISSFNPGDCQLPAPPDRCLEDLPGIASDVTCGQKAAEDIIVNAGGVMDQIAWRGFYHDGNADCSEGAGDTFRLTVYTDANGHPGPEISSQLISEPMDDGLGGFFKKATGNVLQTTAGPVTEYEYAATLLEPVPVVAGETLWLEISNLPSGVPGCWWHWEDAGPGNNYSLVSCNDDLWDTFKVRTKDLTLCINAIGPGPELFVGCCLCGEGCVEMTIADCEAVGGLATPGLSCVDALCPGLPPNDNCADAIVLAHPGGDPSEPIAHAFDMSCATRSGPAPSCVRFEYDALDRLVKTIVYTYTAPSDGRVRLQDQKPAGKKENTNMMAVYHGCEACPLSEDDEAACTFSRGDLCSDGMSTSLSLDVQAGACYTIVVAHIGSSDQDGVAATTPIAGTLELSLEPTAVAAPIGDPLPAGYPHDRRKNRYISFDPNNAENDGTSVAFKVELTAIAQGSCSGGAGGDPAEVDFCRADRGADDCNTCVGAPAENSCIDQPIDCVSGTCTPTGESCVNDAPHSGGSNVGTVWWVGPFQGGAHLLVSLPFRMERSDWENPVHVGDCEVVPEAAYRVTAVVAANGTESTGSVSVETTLFAPASSSFWGDAVGKLEKHCGPDSGPNDPGDIREPVCNTDADCSAPNPFCRRSWLLPDGSVNFDDVNAALALIAPGPTSVAPEITWVDVHGNVSGTSGSQNFDPPNFVLNFSDVGQILSGFGGFPYKGFDPADCP